MSTFLWSHDHVTNLYRFLNKYYFPQTDFHRIFKMTDTFIIVIQCQDKDTNIHTCLFVYTYTHTQRADDIFFLSNLCIRLQAENICPWYHTGTELKIVLIHDIIDMVALLKFNSQSHGFRFSATA